MPDVELALGLGDAVTVYAANPSKLVSTGAAGLVRYGFNQHAWPYYPNWYRPLGAKAMRINVGFSRFVQFGAYPGPGFDYSNANYNQVAQAAVDAAIADGLDVVLMVDSGFPAAPDATRIAFFTAVARANLANVGHIILECGNEPNYLNSSAAAAYAAILPAFAAAVRAVNPSFKIGAPTINASYTGSAQQFTTGVFSTPGIAAAFDIGTFHPYYQTPTASYANDLSAFIARVEAQVNAQGRFDIEYAATEIGYSNAVGLLTQWGMDPNAENVGGVGNTYVQNVEVAADYYSRYIALSRATAKLRLVTFYALKDEGPYTDTNFENGGGHFGVWADYGAGIFLKPAGRVCADMLPYVHAADAAWRYARPNQPDDYFVKLRIGASYVLIAWTVGAPHQARIVIKAQAAGVATWNVAAGAMTKAPFAAGISSIAVPLGRRAVIVASPLVPIEFPEFA